MNKKKKSKNNKNRLRSLRVYISIAALIIVTFVAISIVLANNEESARVVASGAKIYFFDAQAQELRPEHRAMNAETNTEKVKFVLEELSVGPKTAGFHPSVPPYILQSATISGTNVEVVVSEEYHNLKIDEEILARAAIVYSLTELGFVETVTISVNGTELLKPNGQPLGKIRASDIVVTPDANPEGASLKTITLYFADETNTGLVAETRTITTNPNETLAKYVVNEIIRGPVLDSLNPTVPPETRLLEINISDGVCNVDLSREFITKHVAFPGSETLAIYSIVNSLCQQSDIKNVQFLIEGKRQEVFGAETGFNNLFEARDMPPAEKE